MANGSGESLVHLLFILVIVEFDFGAKRPGDNLLAHDAKKGCVSDAAFFSTRHSSYIHLICCRVCGDEDSCR